jgi:hypothetical protein
MALVGTSEAGAVDPAVGDRMTGGTSAARQGHGPDAVRAGRTPPRLLAPFVASRLGRRPAFAVFCVASLGVTALLSTACCPSATARRCSRTHILFTGIYHWRFYGWFPLYLPELFPTACARPARASATTPAACCRRRRAGAGQLWPPSTAATRAPAPP